MNFTLKELKEALKTESNEMFKAFCVQAYKDKFCAGAVDTKEFIDLCRENYATTKLGY